MTRIKLSDIFKEKEPPVPPVSGDKIFLYDFLYTKSQWLRGQKIEHEFRGVIQLGISLHNNDTLKCEVHFKKINAKRKSNFIPEYILLWDYVQRADFFINSKSQISLDFKSLGQYKIFKEKANKAAQYLEGERYQKIVKVLKEMGANPAMLRSLFEMNPVIQLLCREHFFRNKINENTGGAEDTSTESFEAKDILRNYFGDGLHLPLKKFYALDKTREEDIIGCCIAKTDPDLMKQLDFSRYMKKLSGKVIIGNKLLLDYSEYYQYGKEEFPVTGSFTKAENYLQTILAEVWYIEEQTLVTQIKQQQDGSR